MAEKQAHTPGPWTFSDCSMSGPNGETVFELGIGSHGRGESIFPSDQDARLIAASPDLLEALRLCLVAMEEIGVVDRCTIPFDQVEIARTKARAAIAKAEGV